MTKGAFHKVYYNFTFTIKVIEDTLNYFSGIAWKTALSNGQLLWNTVFRLQKTFGRETNFVLWVLLHAVVYNVFHPNKSFLILRNVRIVICSKIP